MNDEVVEEKGEGEKVEDKEKKEGKSGVERRGGAVVGMR